MTVVNLTHLLPGSMNSDGTRTRSRKPPRQRAKSKSAYAFALIGSDVDECRLQSMDNADRTRVSELAALLEDRNRELEDAQDAQTK